MTTLYAWANPLSFTGRLDHTWVTTYDIRQHPYASLQDVVAAGEDCWLCWGSFHPHGARPGDPDGYLLEATGDLSLTQCLVKPNAYSQDDQAAQGTIFEYGIDGVCHQLANQTLYGANHQGVAPTVKDAQGYWLSSYLYGDYGRTHNAWRQKQSGCGTSSFAAGPDAGGDMPDHFMDHAQRVLGDDTGTMREIAEQREMQRAVVLDALSARPTTAEEINQRNRESLIALQDRIGRDKFHAVFEYYAEEVPDLVDPETFAASRGGAPDPA